MFKPIYLGLLPIAFAVAFAIIIIACSGDPTPMPAPESEASAVTRITLASTDLAVGENRVVFALIRPGIGSIKDAQVEVQTFFLSGSMPNEAVQTASATFQTWPGGTAGGYRANLSFDRSGEWGLGVVATLPDESSVNVGAMIEVKQTSSTPAIGSPAPRSESKTASDADALTDITTDPRPDSDLYRMTIPEALNGSEPLLVTFATPAYCRTATCGPQMNIVKELKDKYAGRMNFIHVEVYDNPAEIREQGLSAARTVPALAEWGLPSEPWTFVVDGGGIVRAKYEGFVDSDELEIAISEVLP
ncbi:MAG: hypothetical protein OXC95_02870 [Dehalococcoidia bacterium]|nr:hypothetical protein [Dehalococcoidia bacterium]